MSTKTSTKPARLWACPRCRLETTGFGVGAHKAKHRRQDFAAWLREHPIAVGDLLSYAILRDKPARLYTVRGIGAESITTEPEGSSGARSYFRLPETSGPGYATRPSYDLTRAEIIRNPARED